MPGELVSLSPETTPDIYYQTIKDTIKDTLGMIPDGTGLQILFEIDGQYYVIAGPRSGSVLTVNGGTIEETSAPFFAQLSEELDQETFGLMKVSHTEAGYELILNDSKHSLTVLNDQTFQMYKTGKYAYVTFTAVCKTATLEELSRVAVMATPTARFWNKIGNYLFPHFKDAPKNEEFAEYWSSKKAARSAFIDSLVEEYKTLTACQPLLIDPTSIFESGTIELALNTLHELKSYVDLSHLFKHTVGRYSERSEYRVFNASDLLHGTEVECKKVSDVSGIEVATGIFNKDAVAAVFAALMIAPRRPAPAQDSGLGGGVTTIGIFSSRAASPSRVHVAATTESVEEKHPDSVAASL